jgi:hypothetical protein
MLFALGMGKAANDNYEEPNSFISLGLATALLINRIRNAQTLLELTKIDEQKTEEGAADRTDTGRAENEPSEHTRAVNKRLEDFRAFERRYTKI